MSVGFNLSIFLLPNDKQIAMQSNHPVEASLPVRGAVLKGQAAPHYNWIALFTFHEFKHNLKSLKFKNSVILTERTRKGTRPFYSHACRAK